MPHSRQQSRALLQRERKQTESAVRAPRRAKARMALQDSIRQPNAPPRRSFTTFLLVLEFFCYVLGGPLVWMFYTPSWFRER